MKESRIGDLQSELQDEEYRYAYAEDFLNAWVATQIVVLREQRGLSQKQLGDLIGTKQPGISRLEDVNHSTWKTETLKRVARALGVRLKITFETFGTLLGEDAAFNREFLKRPEFKDDPVFATDSEVTEAVAALVGAGAEQQALSQNLKQIPTERTIYTGVLNMEMRQPGGGEARFPSAAHAGIVEGSHGPGSRTGSALNLAV